LTISRKIKMDTIKYFVSGSWCCPPDHPFSHESYTQEQSPDGSKIQPNKETETEVTIDQDEKINKEHHGDESGLADAVSKLSLQEEGSSNTRPHFCETCSKRNTSETELTENTTNQAKIDELTALIETQQKEITALRAKVARFETPLSEGLSNPTPRTHAGHVRRSDPSSAISSGFPGGEELCHRFVANVGAFEGFVKEAMYVMESMVAEHEDAMEVLVCQVLRPVHELTLHFVTRSLTSSLKVLADEFGVSVPGDRVPSEASLVKQFWLYTQQRRMPLLIDKIPETDICNLFSKQAMVCRLHARMTGEMSVPQLVRRYMRIHVLALLSDPRCYLEPWPGALVIHKEGHTREVQGSDPETCVEIGDGVQVVHCGLYFEQPGPRVLPAVPSSIFQPRSMMWD